MTFAETLPVFPKQTKTVDNYFRKETSTDSKERTDSNYLTTRSGYLNAFSAFTFN